MKDRKYFKNVLSLTLTVFMLLQSMPLTKLWADSNAEYSFSPSLERAILEVLQIDVIDQETLDSTFELNLENQKIDDLTGIDNFTNLKKVNLQNNKIKDIQLLDQLDKLNEVILDNQNIDYYLEVSNQEYVLNDLVKNLDGEIIEPSNITHEGIFEGDKIVWDAQKTLEDKVSYNFEQTITLKRDSENPIETVYSGIVSFNSHIILESDALQEEDINLKNTEINNFSQSTFDGEVIQEGTAGEVIWRHLSDNSFEFVPVEGTEGLLDTSSGPDTFKDYLANKEFTTITVKDGVKIKGSAHRLFANIKADVIEFKNVDVSELTRTEAMFANFKGDIDLGPNFYAPRVIKMAKMFYEVDGNINLGGQFDTLNVTNMDSMFSDVNGTIILGDKFDTSNVVNMDSMFAGLAHEINFGDKFSTGNVVNMDTMFVGIKTKLTLPTTFTTTSNPSMSAMFRGANSPLIDLSQVADFKSSQNGSAIFENASIDHLILGDTVDFSDAKLMTSEKTIFNRAKIKKITLSSGTKLQDIEYDTTDIYSENPAHWGISDIDENYYEDINQILKLYDGSQPGTYGPYYEINFYSEDGKTTTMYTIDSIIYPPTVTNPSGKIFKHWNSNLEGTGNIFNESINKATKDKNWYAIYADKFEVNFNVGGSIIETIDVEDGASLDITQIPEDPTLEGYNFKEWNTISDGTGSTFDPTTTISEDMILFAIFESDYNSEIIQQGIGGDVMWTHYADNTFIFSPINGVKGELEIASGRGKYLSYIYGKEFGNVIVNDGVLFPEDSQNAFMNFKADRIEFGNINFSNVKNSSYFFKNVKSTLVLGNSFDTSNVTNMTEMFSEFNGVLDLGNSFDTSKVQNMSRMFSSSEINQLNLGDLFDTSMVTDMSEMFSWAKLPNLNLKGNFDTSSVENMYRMFKSFEGNDINFGNKFDTSNVIDMTEMFDEAKTNLTLPALFSTQSNPAMSNIFRFFKGDVLDLSNVAEFHTNDSSYPFFARANIGHLKLGDTTNLESYQGLDLRQPLFSFAFIKTITLAPGTKLADTDYTARANIQNYPERMGRITDETLHDNINALFRNYDSSMAGVYHRYFEVIFHDMDLETNYFTEYNTPLLLPAPNHTDTGTFIGWNTREDGSGDYLSTDSIIPTDDEEYYAIYNNRYTVSFKVDSATHADVVTDANNKIPESLIPANPTKEGYTFKGWNTREDGTGSMFDPHNDLVTDNMTVYAIFEVTQYTIKFDVEGTVVESIMIDENQLIDPSMISVEPTKPGFTFIEWNTAVDGTGIKLDSSGITPTEDMLFYAIFEYDHDASIVYRGIANEVIWTHYSDGLLLFTPLYGGVGTLDTRDIIDLENPDAPVNDTYGKYVEDKEFNKVIIDDGVIFPENSTGAMADIKANLIEFKDIDLTEVRDLSSFFDNTEAAIDFGDHFDTSLVTDMSYMFSAYKNEDGDLILGSDFSTENVTNMTAMFQGTHVQSLDLGSKFDTLKVTNMETMFRLSQIPNLDLGDKFNTINVENMEAMFDEYRGGDVNFGDYFDTRNVINMKSMFHRFNYDIIDGTYPTYSKILDLGDKFDTSKVEDMSHMFESMSGQILLGDKFDTSNVKFMQYMFGGRPGDTRSSSIQGWIENLDLGDNFDTSNVENMSHMFEFVRTINGLGDKFDTSNVKDMSGMFKNVRGSIDLGDHFNTENVENMSEMFNTIQMPENEDLILGDKFNTHKVKDMNKMFYKFVFESNGIDFGNKFDTRLVENMDHMFSMYNGDLKLPNKFSTQSIISMEGLFYDFEGVLDLSEVQEFKTTDNEEIFAKAFFEKLILGDTSDFSIATSISGKNIFHNTDIVEITLSPNTVLPNVEYDSKIFVGGQGRKMSLSEADGIMYQNINDLLKDYDGSRPGTYRRYFEVVFQDALTETSYMYLYAPTNPLHIPTASPLEHHTFKSWNTKADGTGRDMQQYDKNVNKDATWYAIYDLNQYSVNFESEGVVLDTVSTDYNTTLDASSVPANPTKEGYTFEGWNTAADGSGTTFDPSSSLVTSDITVYAIFSINQYSVSFESEGVVLDTVLTDYNTTLDASSVPANPTKFEHTFVEWNTAADGSGTTFDPNSSLVTSDITVYAIFNINQYSVNFESEGVLVGTVLTDYNTTLDASSVPANPTKEGYTFEEWNTAADGSGTTFDPSSSLVTSDITVYAIFSINEYSVSFESEGVVFDTVTTDYNTLLDASLVPVNPTKFEHTFVEWNTAVDGSGITFDPSSSLVTSDITVYAIFSINQYSVNFESEGVVLDTVSTDYNTILDDSLVPANPIKEGYTFVEWNTAVDGSGTTFDPTSALVTSDITVYAIFSINQYSVNFESEGVLVGTVSTDYNTILDDSLVPANPTKEGYTFVEWNTAADGSGTTFDPSSAIVTSDITVYAIFEKNIIEGDTELDNSNNHNPDTEVSNDTEENLSNAGQTSNTGNLGSEEVTNAKTPETSVQGNYISYVFVIFLSLIVVFKNNLMFEDKKSRIR